jgi:cytosine/adenosine deaminase-related metal-dependent hydrolase
LSFRKFSADNIFTGTGMPGSDFVLITNKEGIIEDIVKEKDAGEDIQYFKGILTPGFINCHCHLELSHMRGLIPEQTGLVDFVFKVITERHFEEEEILEAISKAEDEMLANGIVAVGDICNNTLTLSQKLKKRLAYYNFIEVSGWLPQVAEQRFTRSKAYYDAFVNGKVVNDEWAIVNEETKINEAQQKTINDKQQTSLVPHAPYSVSEELWNLLQPFFSNKTISIHNQETSFEDELFIQNRGDFLRMYQLMKIDTSFFKPTGKSSLQSYFYKLNNAKHVILVHNTFTKEEDVEFANLQSAICNLQLTWCLCINANLYIENKIPSIDMFIKNGCAIVLGTDSLASNRHLNLMDEMKNIHKYFPNITMQQLLQWATINGAQALQMDDKLGSFEKGKQPGVVLIDNLQNEHLTATSTATRLV